MRSRTTARCAGHFAWKQPPYEYEYDKLPIEVLLGGPMEGVFPA